jgi:hypothetical protein
MWILPLLLIFLQCSTTVQDLITPPPPFSFVPVFARVKNKSNLILKDSPTNNASSIESIMVPDNYIVLATNRTSSRETLNNHEDYWYEIKYKDKVGWVFGKYLDFSEEEVLQSRSLPIVENNPELTNFKKIKKFYDENLKFIKYEQALQIYGKPLKEQRYTLSNHHGGFNRYIEMEYSDLRVKFLDKVLFEISIYSKERLNSSFKNIQIGSEWQEIEFEFGLPFSLSKDKITYPTCHPLIPNLCTGQYANQVEFSMEDNKIQSIMFTRYVD